MFFLVGLRELSTVTTVSFHLVWLGIQSIWIIRGTIVHYPLCVTGRATHSCFLSTLLLFRSQNEVSADSRHGIHVFFKMVARSMPLVDGLAGPKISSILHAVSLVEVLLCITRGAQELAVAVRPRVMELA